MRPLLLAFATACIALGAPVDDFLAAASAKHGDAGAKAARFLVENMPAKDRAGLSAEFLGENLDLALQARAEFPWAAKVPEDIFLNDVLPYAVFDEPRDAWRADFLLRSRAIVKDAQSASDAAQALNRQLFNQVKVHYNTGRKRPNQSPKESMESGKATCTGLSILLVDACRSVGIPARAVGTPLWANERGHHTWVEIWDGDWHFTGADEPDAAGRDPHRCPHPPCRPRTTLPRHPPPDPLAPSAIGRRGEMDKKALTIGDKTLKWMAKPFGDPPTHGRSLWISMHGGGNAPASVNDQQWTNQSRLYEPTEGIYIAPRAPTDTWNLWHEGHIDPLFQRLIDDHVALAGVDPDQVYLMGYSAGGDGVWQLAPRMADRFAAAAMMAGHPNEASLLGLRDLPFALFMGGDDAAYNRNKIATSRAADLDNLAQADPGGYVHFARIYPGLGHWMKKQDAEALPWMAKFRRDPWPKKVVWQQDDVVHHRFYWLQIPGEIPVKDRQKTVARVDDRTITLEGEVPSGMVLRLSDRLLDLDRPLVVRANGREVFNGKAVRRAADIVASLEERADPSSAATALVRLD